MNDKTSISQLKARLDKDINDVDAAIALGNHYYDAGDAAQSIVYYRLALDINPDLSGVRTDMGTMYWRNENIGLAEHAFRETIKRNPAFSHAYVNLGLLLHRAKNNVTEARATWQKLLTLNPEQDVATRARELLQETAAQIH